MGDYQSTIQAACDEHVEWIYRQAGCSTEAPPGAYKLATCLGAKIGICRSRSRSAGHPEITYTRGRSWSVRVQPNLPLPVANLAIARGVAEWSQRQVTAMVGRPVDTIAMAILLPAEAARRSVDDLRWSASKIAEFFVLPLDLAEARLRQVMYSLTRSGMFLRTW